MPTLLHVQQNQAYAQQRLSPSDAARSPWLPNTSSGEHDSGPYPSPGVTPHAPGCAAGRLPAWAPQNRGYVPGSGGGAHPGPHQALAPWVGQAQHPQTNSLPLPHSPHAGMLGAPLGGAAAPGGPALPSYAHLGGSYVVNSAGAQRPLACGGGGGAQPFPQQQQAPVPGMVTMYEAGQQLPSVPWAQQLPCQQQVGGHGMAAQE